MARKYTKWVLKKAFEGLPKREDFEVVEDTLPPLKDGEFLVEAMWLTVDPYMRVMFAVVGNTFGGAQISKVIESKNKDYSVGDLVCGMFQWTTHAICDGDLSKHVFGLWKIDPSITLNPSTALGILGMPGGTAYFGLLDVCKPKAGETLVITGAAGAVGSVVGQIGKIKGMRVVGFTGSDEKVAYLKSIGFDAVFNYKTMSSLSDALKEGCPNGVDCFFDNVGGEFFETVLTHMNTDGRVAVCGASSGYNLTETPKARPVSGLILSKQLNVKGFFGARYFPEWPGAFKEMAQWIQEDKLKYNEAIYEGFDKTFDAFLSLFKGTHIGKVVVKL